MLEQGGGGPLPPPGLPTKSSGGGRRKALIVGAVVGIAAVGGGAFAAYSWLTGTGPQPAEALPADTLGYVSIDLDPSGSQKIEALKTLKKFPAADEWLDEKGLAAGDDIREFLFDQAKEEEEACEGLSFEDDVKPWLGDRFAIAAIDRGDEEPAPVGVVQVTDPDEALDKVESLIEECGGNRDDGGLAVSGDWLIVAESDDIAEQVADDAEESTLADDEDFQKWTEAAGDPGILTAYASPDAGKVLADEFGSLVSSGGVAECSPALPDVELGEEFPTDDFTAPCPDPTEMEGDPAPDEVTQMLEDFGGMGLTVRFDDGSLEMETAGDVKALGLEKLVGSDAGGDVIATLPEDTAAAFGVGFEAGWFDEALDYAATASGAGDDVDEMIAQAEEELGLSLPEDAETFFGESAAIAVGSDFDPEVIFNSESGISELPVGAKIKGDPEAIQEVLDKIKAAAPSPEEAEIVGSESEGDHIAIGPNPDYLGDLLEDGGLGDTETYQDVVREDDVSSIFFVNFDAGDGWLANIAGDDQELKENLEPLAGLGVTGWEDDGVGHTVFRLTTD